MNQKTIFVIKAFERGNLNANSYVHGYALTLEDAKGMCIDILDDRGAKYAGAVYEVEANAAYVDEHENLVHFEPSGWMNEDAKEPVNGRNRSMFYETFGEWAYKHHKGYTNPFENLDAVINFAQELHDKNYGKSDFEALNKKVYE